MPPDPLAISDDISARLADALGPAYRLEERIGRGGMAAVYRASDLKHGRPVAIKVLRPELVTAGPEAQRFLREIRIAARLSHPNILPLIDSGTIGSGRNGEASVPYYVMPYVDGESLRARLERTGTVPRDEGLRIAINVAEALDYAHRQDVVHRDIKPENILLHEGQAVVADFGIARAISAAATEDVTARGLLLGTPSYMSPEQVAGDSGLDGRGDLYALACVLFEMLTGKPPFAAESVRGILMKHLVDPIPSLAGAGVSAPAALEQALHRGLAKEPADRWPNGRAFAEALQAVGPARGPATGQRVPPRSIAVIPFVNASSDPENEYLADGITDELIGALARARGFEVASRTSVYAQRGSGTDPRALGRILGVEALLQGSVRRSGERIRIDAELTRATDGHLVWADRYERPIDDLFTVQAEMASRIVRALKVSYLSGGRSPVTKRYTESPVAHQLYLKGRYAWNLRTPEGVALAIRYFEQAIEADPNYALAYAGLSDAHALHIDYRAAPVAVGMREARINAERALELDDELAEAHTALGWVHLIHDWDWEKARERFERAITLNPRYATARQWYAWYLVVMNRLDEALDEGRIARDLDPNSVSIQRSLGWIHYYARQPEQAITELEQALLMNPTSDETQWVLGLALTMAGRYDEAERALEEAHANSTAYLHALASLGRLAGLTGRRAHAENILATLHEAARTQYVSPVDFVRVYLALDDHDQVFAWIERAYQERRGWLCYLRVDPIVDPIRSDPRFGELLRRMNL